MPQTAKLDSITALKSGSIVLVRCHRAVLGPHLDIANETIDSESPASLTPPPQVENVAAVVLAGGVGKRMEAGM